MINDTNVLPTMTSSTKMRIKWDTSQRHPFYFAVVS